jgi:hypothetical protein
MKTTFLVLILSIITNLNSYSNSKLTENQKIDKLIEYVAGLNDATFIRNGSEHTAKEAANHLKRKRDWIGDDLKTAKQFIEKAATKSSFSGKYYMIKFKDGRKIKNCELLYQKLKEIEK